MLAFCLAAALSVQVPVASQDAARPAATPQSRPGQSAPAPAASRPPEIAEALELQKQVAALYAGGKYAEAARAAERALALVRKARGPDHPDVAFSLNNLAKMYESAGDLARAEPLYQRALSILENAAGIDAAHVALALNNLASLYAQRGDFVRAERLQLRAVAIYEKSPGPGGMNLAVALNNLANLYRNYGDFERAERLYLRSLSIREKALGPEDSRLATVLNNLALIYERRGELDRAAPLLRRSLDISERAHGAGHPEVAKVLNNLALAHQGRGDYAGAELLLRRSLDINRKALGPAHPEVARSLDNLVALHLAAGDVGRAVALQSQAEEARERNLVLVLAAGSERQKHAYLSMLTGEANAAVSLHTRSAPADARALRLSLTAILRRKGRALDAMSDQTASLRRRLDPQGRALLDQLSEATSQLAALAFGGGAATPDHGAAASRLEAEIERLQDAVSRRGAEFGARAARPITLEHVRQALPPGSALVEFFAYQPRDPKAKPNGEADVDTRYVAYVLRKKGDPVWADLGRAYEVDSYVLKFLSELKCPQEVGRRAGCQRGEAMRMGRVVDERVMRPVRALLGGARQVFVSPDGLLNLVPFGALVDEGGKYLVESYSLTYLTSGRDLLRAGRGGESREPPLVLGDPVFGEVRAGDGASSSSQPTTAAQPFYFSRLKATAEEAKAVGSILASARVLVESRATERALKRASSPRVLHIATHGFFQPAGPAGADTGDGDGQAVVAREENPLLRSGLALAGANAGRGEGGEDGVLTALEASALDLWGTKLVVLSACETGLGEVKSGEGVYGLRRALVLAGSESQVISLWKVSDEATRDLMVAYYNRLRAGEGRTEALRRVQLEILRGDGRQQSGAQRGIRGDITAPADRRHPYFWAAFIPSGDWRPMTAQPARAK